MIWWNSPISSLTCITKEQNQSCMGWESSSSTDIYITGIWQISTASAVPKWPHSQHEKVRYSIHGSPLIRSVRVCTWLFRTALSHWKALYNLSTVIDTNVNAIKTGSSVRNRVFVMGWQRPRQYKKQTFLVMRGDSCNWLGRFCSNSTSERLETVPVKNWPIQVPKSISGLDRALFFDFLR